MKNNRTGTEDAVLQDGKLWFCLSDYRYLISIDVETGETKTYAIPMVGTNIHRKAFISMALFGRKLYLIPFYDRVIMQFDMDLEEFEKIEIDDEILKNKGALFLGVTVYHDYLFVMGVFAPVILRINTLNNYIEYITEWKQEHEKIVFDSKDIYFRRQCVVKDDKLYVPFCNANAILEVNCFSKETTVHRLGEKKHGYSGVCLEGDSLWLSPRKKGDIVKWNIATKQIETIPILGLQSISQEYSYVGIVADGNKKILFPMEERDKVDIAENNIEELQGKFSFVQDDGAHAIFYEENSGIITLLERASGMKREIKIDRVDIDVERILSENNNFIIENNTVSIRNFIEYVNTNL